MRTLRRPTPLVSLLLAAIPLAALAAPPPAIHLTHSTSSTPVASGVGMCLTGPHHEENSYYRAFDLAALMPAPTSLRISVVEFAVEEAVGGTPGAGQLVEVRLYTATALPPVVAGLTLIASESVSVPDQTFGTVSVPFDVVVSPGTLLVVELHTPDGTGAGHRFLPGANSAGQSGPSYLRTSACAVHEITNLALLGFADVMWIMSVHGDLELPAAPPMCTLDHFTVENPTALPLLDPGEVTSTITLSGLPSYILDVNVKTSIGHTFSADLDVTLTSPQGTVVTLTTDNGGSNDHCFDGTVWDDDANPGGQVPYFSNTGLVTDYGTFANGVTVPYLVPEEGLVAFLGEDPNGTWTLTVADDVAVETGTLNAWTLDVTTLTSTPHRVVNQRENTSPVAIPVGPGVVMSTIDVAGVPPYVSLVGLDTFITHPFPADLDVTLTSPEGTVVTITTDNGGGNADVFNGTGWNALADFDGVLPYASNQGMVTDHVYAAGVVATPLTPEESFGAFTGEDPNGTWTLTISDDLMPDGGSLDRWSLSFDALTCETTTTTSSSSTTTSTTTTTTTPSASSTTTTSTLPGAGACIRASTVDSVRCRLAAMIARVAADVPPPAAKLGALLRKADASVARAGTVGVSSPGGRRALRKATRLVRKFDRKLGGAPGRTVAGAVRTELRDAATALLADLPAVQ